MKRVFLLLCILAVITIMSAACNKKDGADDTAGSKEVTVTAAPTESPTAAPTAAPTVAPASATAGSGYADGVYEVQTEPDGEKYYTKATVTIEGGKITAVDWTIYDSAREDTPFDGEYYKILEPFGAVYGQQGKDDWAGSRGYAEALIESQDIDKVDAVSGATWTNRKFKEIVNMALEQAASK